MKPIAATAITTAALVTACGGNTSTPADPTAAYLAAVHANMKAAGMPPDLEQHIQSGDLDQGMLMAGHRLCDMAAQGKSPDEIVTLLQPNPGKEQFTKRNVLAAETYLCPQYKH